MIFRLKKFCSSKEMAKCAFEHKHWRLVYLCALIQQRRNVAGQAFPWLLSPNCILLAQMKTTWGSSNAFWPWSSRGRARQHPELLLLGSFGCGVLLSRGRRAFCLWQFGHICICSWQTGCANCVLFSHIDRFAWSIPLWAQNKQALIHQDGINGSWCLCKRAPYVSKLRRGTEMLSWKLSAWLQGWGHLGSTLSRLTLKGQLVLLGGQSNLGPGCI